MEEGKNEPVTPTKKKRKLKQRQFSGTFYSVNNYLINYLIN